MGGFVPGGGGGGTQGPPGPAGPQGPPGVVVPATTTTLGGVIIGANVTVQADGTISVAAAAVVSVFGRTGAVVAVAGDYTAAQVTNAVSTLGLYANPPWITSLAWAKITGAPSVSSYQTPWLSDIDAATHTLINIGYLQGSGTGDLTSRSDMLVEKQGSTGIATYRARSGGVLIQSGVDNGAGGYTFVGSFSAHPLLIYAGSIERMRITAAGNAGIGNTLAVLPFVDATALQLVVGPSTGTGYGAITATCNSATQGTLAALSFANYAIAGAEKRLAMISGSVGNTAGAGLLDFYTVNAGVVGHWMRITAGGNIGIGPGVVAPSNSLEVAGPSVNWQGSATGNAIFRIAGGTAGAYSHTILSGVESTGATPHGWIQAVEPGVVFHPLLLNPGGGGVTLSAPANAAIADTYLGNNNFTCFVGPGGTTLHFRVKDGGGTVREGSITLAP